MKSKATKGKLQAMSEKVSAAANRLGFNFPTGKREYTVKNPTGCPMWKSVTYTVKRIPDIYPWTKNCYKIVAVPEYREVGKSEVLKTGGGMDLVWFHIETE